MISLKATKLPTIIKMSLLSELWSLLTAGNVLLLLFFLLLLHHLVEFYQFRGMPPGPRLYSIPCFGNFLSFDSRAGKSLYESTQRWVSRFFHFCRSYFIEKGKTNCEYWLAIGAASLGMPDMVCAHFSFDFCIYC